MRVTFFATILAGLSAAGRVAAADLAVVAPLPSVAPSPYTIQLNSEFRFFSFTGDRGIPVVRPDGTPATGGKGTQIYVPTTLSLSGNPNDVFHIDAALRAGYVTTRQNTVDVTGGVGTFTDTVPTVTATYLGIDGVQPFAGLSLNLPTGKPSLLGLSSNARLDPDLVDVPSFGEGVNVGPTIGVNVPINPTVMATLSAGYTARGNFRQDGPYSPFFPQTTNKVHPGDLVTASASITAQVAPVLLQLAFTYLHFGKVESNDVDQLQSGNSYSISGLIGYDITDALAVRVIPSFSYTERNRSMAPPVGALMLEDINSNSALAAVRVEPTYRLGDYTFGPIGSFQYRDKNSYDPTTLQFIPAKTRESAGAQASYVVNAKTLINVRYEHVWTHVSDATLSVGTPGVSREADIAVIGGTYTF